MKVYVMESRKINHTNFRHFDNPWNFFCVFASEELAQAMINVSKMPGDLTYARLEFKYTEQVVYGSGE